MTAPDPADPDLRAAEYVLGTLDAGERDGVEREAAADPAVRARIRAWEDRLSPLMGTVPPVVPPARLRAAILRALPAPGPPVSEPSATASIPGQVATLRAQVRRWRIAAAATGLLAAGLALFIAAGTGPQGGGRYVAVVQAGGAVPALIVRVDTAAGTAQVRPIGAEAPAGHSLELWYVGAAGPKTLGVLGAAPSRVSLPPGASADGVIAVTVEPPGGSPNGLPTGPAIYTGKLIAE